VQQSASEGSSGEVILAWAYTPYKLVAGPRRRTHGRHYIKAIGICKDICSTAFWGKGVAAAVGRRGKADSLLGDAAGALRDDLLELRPVDDVDALAADFQRAGSLEAVEGPGKALAEAPDHRGQVLM